MATMATTAAGCSSCRSRHGHGPDAHHARPPTEAATPFTFGPPNPWDAIADSTATGPQADATRATLTAVRAAIGFLRIERDARTYCPTLDDLARTPAAGFDPSTMSRDAWGTPFEIECQGARVRIRSFGPDRIRGTPDDLITE